MIDFYINHVTLSSRFTGKYFNLVSASDAMKKMLIISIILLFSVAASAQSTLIDRSGTITFFSEAPLENIKATNQQVVGAIDKSNGNLAVSMRMVHFQFAKSLMQEHFNENYVESEKFPKATFKGSLADFDPSLLEADGEFKRQAKGEITIHGVTRPLNTIVSFIVSDQSIRVSTIFKLKVADFDIDIPTVVFYNIAEEVEVTVHFTFDK